MVVTLHATKLIACTKSIIYIGNNREQEAILSLYNISLILKNNHYSTSRNRTFLPFIKTTGHT